jgi:hypothetical protein
MSTIQRKRGAKAAQSRDSGGFIALPWAVVDSKAFLDLSHPAKALLIELARQLNPGYDNNGTLVASRQYLRTRGWNSSDVAYRAKNELLKAGFIHETFKGSRPNKASWYAVTWHPLPRHPKYDPGAVELFGRSAYAKNDPLVPARERRRVRIGPAPVERASA